MSWPVFRNVIVHGYLGIDLAAVWLVVDQDLPPLAAALDRMFARVGNQVWATALTVVLGSLVRARRPDPCRGAPEADARCGGRGAARGAARRHIVGIGLLGHNTFVYGAFALVAFVWWLLYRTRFGLRLRATGENPAMVDAAGVSVSAMRYRALAINGVLCALAGAYLVLALNPSFIPNMTAGRGYMALAAMIFGKWHPIGALLACLLFGLLEAVAIRLQGWWCRASARCRCRRSRRCRTC